MNVFHRPTHLKNFLKPFTAMNETCVEGGGELRRDGDAFICPNCGPIDYVITHDLVWVAYLMHPRGGGVEYKRDEELDVATDSKEYECPKCRQVFRNIVIQRE